MTRSYAGRLLDAAGQPIAGAMLSVVRGSAPTPEIAACSTDEGKFAVGLPSGTFTLAVHLNGRELAQVGLDTASLTLEFDVQLNHEGEPIVRPRET